MKSTFKTLMVCLFSLLILRTAIAVPNKATEMLRTKHTDPIKMALYIANSGAGTISQFRIAENGKLEPMIPPTVPAGKGYINKVVLDSTNHFAYGLDLQTHSVFQYRIGSDGRLMPLTQPNVMTGRGSDGNIYITHNNRSAYCPNIDDNTISQFQRNQEGRLNQLLTPTIQAGIAPADLISAPDDKILYCANYQNQTILAYNILDSGQLSQFGSPTPLTAKPTVFCLSFNSQVLYSNNVAPGSISQFHVGSDGLLTKLAPDMLLSSEDTGDLVLHPATHSAYITDTGKTLFQYHIQDDGSLSALSPSQITLPGGPAIHIAISDRVISGSDKQNRSFLYTNLQFSRQISQYEIAVNGTLHTLSPGVINDKEGKPQSMAVDPTGHFLYVVNDQSNALSQFQISDNGQLVPLTPESVPCGGSGLITIVTLPAADALLHGVKGEKH